MAFSDDEKQKLTITAFQIFQSIALAVYLGDNPTGPTTEAFTELSSDALVAAKAFRDAMVAEDFFDAIEE